MQQKKANFIYLLHVLWVKHLLHGKILWCYYLEIVF